MTKATICSNINIWLGRKEGLRLTVEVGGMGEKNKNSTGERVLGLGLIPSKKSQKDIC